MSRLNSGRNVKTGCIKYITKDIPFSYDCFSDNFVQLSNQKIQTKCHSVKLSLTVQELSQVLGDNWNIVVQKNTSTRQRIIGDITLHQFMIIQHALGKYIKKIN